MHFFPVPFYQLCHHGDDTAVVFPDHGPEGLERCVKRPLCDDVLSLQMIALNTLR